MLCLDARRCICDRFYVYHVAGTADGEVNVVLGYVFCSVMYSHWQTQIKTILFEIHVMSLAPMFFSCL
jgi:hypothetical protein